MEKNEQNISPEHSNTGPGGAVQNAPAASSAKSKASCYQRSCSVNSSAGDNPDEVTPLLGRRSSKRQNPEESDRMPTRVRFSSISVPVYILVIVFAWASWIDMNGLWVEVPLLVSALPEGWNLPSYLVIIIQVANIGAVLFTIGNRAAPKLIKEWPVVYFIITIGAMACIFLSFFWDRTTVVLGKEHSTALIILTAFLALVDCTSSVVFLPYMAYFKPQYMTAFYIGEGLSGLLPGLVGLAQGVGSDPTCINKTVVIFNDSSLTNVTEHKLVPEYPMERFSIQTFFIFLFVMVCFSGVAFTALHFLPFCQKEKVSQQISYDVCFREESATSEESAPDRYKELSGPSGTSETAPVPSPDSTRDTKMPDFPRTQLTTAQFVFLLVLVAWCNGFTNGVLPSTQSYSSKPYGNIAYTLSVRLGAIANPLVCFLALFFKVRSLRKIAALTLFATALAGYQLYLAAESPTPPLKGEVAGIVLVIITQVILVACISYIKVTTASLLNSHGGQRALLWCGVVTQIGSFIGASIIFIVINILDALKSEPPC